MAAKRNRWLVGTVLVVALGAFLSLSILPLLSSRGDRAPTASTPGSTPSAADQQAELADRARGYELVLEREPENETAIRGLIETRIQMGDIEGVIEPLEKLVELNPEVPEYQILLGQTRQTVGNLEGAAQAYRQVLTNNPGNMQALQGLVALLLSQDRPQAAVGLLQDTLQTAIQANELEAGSIDTVSVQLLLAQVYVEEDRFEEALALYDEAIDQAGAEDFRPLLAKALVLKEQGQTEEAESLFQRAENMAPAQYKDQIRQLAAGEGTPGAVAPEAVNVPDASGEAPSGDTSSEAEEE